MLNMGVGPYRGDNLVKKHPYEEGDLSKKNCRGDELTSVKNRYEENVRGSLTSLKTRNKRDIVPIEDKTSVKNT